MSAWSCKSCNQELTSEFAILCKEAIKEDLKEIRAEVLAEAAEAGKRTRYSYRNFAGRKTKMNALRNPDGTPKASRKGLRKSFTVSTLIFSTATSACLITISELNLGNVIPELFHSNVRHAIMLEKNRTSHGPDRINSEHLKNLPPVHSSIY